RVVGPSTAPGVVVAPGTPGAIVGDQNIGQTGEIDPQPFTIEDVDGKETIGAQAALRWEATDALTLDAKIMAQRTEIFGFPLVDNVSGFPPTGERITLSASDTTQESLFRGDVEGGTDEWVQFSIAGNYETDFGTFTSTTGYFERGTNEGEESGEFISFTLLPVFIGFSPDPVPLASPIFQELDFRTVVTEARFVSDFDSPFQMTTGVFYQRTDDDESFNPPNVSVGVFDALDQQIADLVALGVPGLPPTEAVATNGDLIFASNRDQDLKEFGLYGEFSYTLFDRLTGTFGIRYFDTEFSFAQTQTGLAAGGFNPLSTGTQSEDGFNLKGLVEYEASDNLYLYASATEGFRIGGANAALPNSPALPCVDEATALGFADPGGFDSDSLWSYEGGAKTTWGGGASTFNVTGFYIDFEDIQQRILLQCGFSFNTNIGAARSIGFEIEATARPVEGLFLSAATGFTDAEFTETVPAPGTGLPAVVNDGDRLQQVPRWTASGTIDYEMPVTSQYDGYVRADFSHVGESISRTVDADNFRIRPSYQILDVRGGLRSEQYEVSLFINNITDERAVFGDNRTLAAEALGRQRVVTNRPRTIGVDLRANF
ncbi:MAG: TonB-dependent receptor, partial [Pseudomonadota bacterium]